MDKNGQFVFKMKNQKMLITLWCFGKGSGIGNHYKYKLSAEQEIWNQDCISSVWWTQLPENHLRKDHDPLGEAIGKAGNRNGENSVHGSRLLCFYWALILYLHIKLRSWKYHPLSSSYFFPHRIFLNRWICVLLIPFLLLTPDTSCFIPGQEESIFQIFCSRSGFGRKKKIYSVSIFPTTE